MRFRTRLSSRQEAPCDADAAREYLATRGSSPLSSARLTSSTLVASTWGNTHSVLVTADGTAIASGPFDNQPGWRNIPDRSLVVATPNGVSFTDLGAA
jgi:glutamine amidotransferase